MTPNPCSTRCLSAWMIPSPPLPSRTLLGLADADMVDGFIESLVDHDVLAGIGILDRLESEGRDLVAFSEQLVTRLRAVLVERLTAGTGADPGAARPLVQAARRLTGIDASRSGLGGYRWQLELCLLAAAEAPAPPSIGPGQPVVPAPQSSPEPVRQPSAQPATEPPAAPAAPLTGAVTPSRPEAARATPGAAPGGDIATVRKAWSLVVAAIGSNPANRPLVASCRPVEIDDGVLVLGFPEDQAFMRDIAERKRRVLEDGIASVVGRSMAVRCVVTNLELVEPVDTGEGDLVSQAKRIFDGELAGVEDID